MKEKKPFVANKNHFFIFIGLFLCLFSLILCLNTSIGAHYVSTPFVFTFGSLAYLVYIAIILIGLRMIFAKKFIKIKIGVYFFGTIFLLVAGFMLYAHFISLNYLGNGNFIAFSTNNEIKSIAFADVYDGIFNNFKSQYNEIMTLSPVMYPLGSGIIGYFLVALFNNIFAVSFGALIVAIIFAVLGIFLYFLPLILRSIGKEKDKEAKPQQKEESETVSDISPNKAAPQKVKNIDVIKEASKIDPDTYESEIMGLPRRNNSISSPTFVEQSSTANDFSISENGSFKPAKFVTESNKNGQQEIPAPTPLVEHPSLEEATKSEQLELDFDAVPELNQELIQQKPVFEEPKAVTNNAAPQVAPAPSMPAAQPVPEKPKPKERVKWIQPSADVLNTYETSEAQALNERVADERKELINIAFNDFGVGAHVEDYTIGPSITRFNIRYDHNVSARSVNNMVQDIQIRLSGVSARFESIVEGQSSSGLEIPNASVTTVSFKDVYEALPDVKKHPLAVAFGKNIEGDVIYADFDEFPHALVSYYEHCHSVFGKLTYHAEHFANHSGVQG